MRDFRDNLKMLATIAIPLLVISYFFFCMWLATWWAEYHFSLETYSTLVAKFFIIPFAPAAVIVIIIGLFKKEDSDYYCLNLGATAVFAVISFVVVKVIVWLGQYSDDLWTLLNS